MKKEEAYVVGKQNSGFRKLLVMSENTTPQEVQQVTCIITVKLSFKAIHALYYHPDATIKKQADKWLQAFQRTSIAWRISVDLLRSSKVD